MALNSLPPIILGALNGMDVPGEYILGTYLYGRGYPHQVYDDPMWSDYMKANNGLRRQVFAKLAGAVEAIVKRAKKGRFPIAETFHAECPENSDFSGYALLHGTNADVGDFKLSGFAEIADAVDPAPGAFDIELDLRFTFNDIVDPNGKYIMDRIRAKAAEEVTLGMAQSYRLSISWTSSCLAEVRPGLNTVYSGYPAEIPRGVRPLPRGKLDWVGAEREHAKQIETRIVQELRRVIPSQNIAKLAERKRRLLWMFYRLSGYMAPNYIDRFNRGSIDDDLPRLVRQRLSSELRTELLQALRGRRPPGVEPP